MKRVGERLLWLRENRAEGGQEMLRVRGLLKPAS